MHEHPHHHQDSSTPLGLAFLLNLTFTLVEIIGGLLTGSIAVLADAVHDLGDSLFLGVAWHFERAAQNRPPDEQFTYGYQRLSLAAALISGVVLTAGSTLIITQALPRLLAPQETHAAGMMGLAVFGIAVNGWAMLRTRHGETMNAKLVSWHLLEDVLGWVTVLVGAAIMWWTSWWWIDPVLALALAVFILFNVGRQLWKVVRLFLQVVPEGVDTGELRNQITSIDGVESIHHLHVWSLDGEHHVLTAHVRLAPGQNGAPIKQAIRAGLDPHVYAHVSIELDQDDADCSLPTAN